MHTFTGRVSQVLFDGGGRSTIRVVCPDRAIPAPGQYVHAWAPAEPYSPLGASLYAAERSAEGFLAAAPVPVSWLPGVSLRLRGPLGHGFDLPPATRRLALAALGDSVSRLIPLASHGLQNDWAVTLFSDAPLPSGMPLALEAYPLGSLPDALAWADFLAIDLPLPALSRLRTALALKEGAGLPCPAQALVFAPAPCASLAECGVCAVPVRGGWKLACKDGPVFDLDALEW